MLQGCCWSVLFSGKQDNQQQVRCTPQQRGESGTCLALSQRCKDSRRMGEVLYQGLHVRVGTLNTLKRTLFVVELGFDSRSCLRKRNNIFLSVSPRGESILCSSSLAVNCQHLSLDSGFCVTILAQFSPSFSGGPHNVCNFLLPMFPPYMNASAKVDSSLDSSYWRVFPGSGKAPVTVLVTSVPFLNTGQWQLVHTAPASIPVEDIVLTLQQRLSESDGHMSTPQMVALAWIG